MWRTLFWFCIPTLLHFSISLLFLATMKKPETCHDTPCYYDEQPLSLKEPVRQHRVRFDMNMTIHPASPFLLPATKTERRPLWYHKKDVRAFSMQDRELIAEYRRLVGEDGGHQGLTHLHIRGLEFKLLDETVEEVRLRQEMVTKLVLKEQAKQWLDGLVNPSQLRAVSLSVSRPAQSTAYKLGKQDMLEATEVYCGGPNGKLAINGYEPKAAVSFDARSMLGNQIKLNEKRMKSLPTNGASVGAAASPTSTTATIERDVRMLLVRCVLPRPVWTRWSVHDSVETKS